jgi:hypothetical protein|tara:strand:+ start:45 stop:203 length:159 start_codon:yes stop_codon:yes gene_type:complete
MKIKTLFEFGFVSCFAFSFALALVDSNLWFLALVVGMLNGVGILINNGEKDE